MLMYNMLDIDCIDSETANEPIVVYLSVTGGTIKASGKLDNLLTVPYLIIAYMLSHYAKLIFVSTYIISIDVWFHLSDIFEKWSRKSLKLLFRGE